MNRKFIISLTVPTTAMKALQHKDIGESIKKEKQEKKWIYYQNASLYDKKSFNNIKQFAFKLASRMHFTSEIT